MEEYVNKTKVLFLCTGNSARSQMAEGFVRHYAGDRFEPYSAGLEPKGINPYTIRVMAERGIPIDDQSSKHLRKYLGRVHFSTVVTVCHNAEKNCPRIWLQAQNHLHWSFEDPAAFEGPDDAKLAKFREVRNLMEEKIRAWLFEQDVSLDEHEIAA
jgi:arsenate reductase